MVVFTVNKVHSNLYCKQGNLYIVNIILQLPVSIWPTCWHRNKLYSDRWCDQWCISELITKNFPSSSSSFSSFSSSSSSSFLLSLLPPSFSFSFSSSSSSSYFSPSSFLLSPLLFLLLSSFSPVLPSSSFSCFLISPLPSVFPPPHRAGIMCSIFWWHLVLSQHW